MEDCNNWSLSKQDTLVLKGVAITAMLFHHLYCCSPGWAEPYQGVLGWMGSLGKVCVAMFLFCSGYGLSVQYDKVDGIKGSVKFMLKRFISFYFNYWAVFVVFVPITVFFFHRALTTVYGENANLIKSIVYDLLGLQGFSSYNITWWFNKLLLILYILFPIIYLGAKKSGIATLVISLFVLRYWMSVVKYDFYGELYLYLFPFVLGIIWNKWDGIDVKRCLQMAKKHDGFHLKPNPWESKVCIIGGVFFLLLMVVFRMYPIIPHWTLGRMDAFVALGVVILVRTIRRLGVSMKVLAFLGKHSANIYLIHTFVNSYWHLSWLHNGVVMRSGMNFFVLLSICLLFSIMLERMKEKIGVYKLLNIIKLRLL